ncbi:zinc finger protein 227 [Patella vulgata]|uniref:zinc finger protein 227 n=1 Tax=Patella vulgata TaxID=6465 RepID=UPI00217F7250|nr:zinc finger protein 227 [Patella vulgata]
MEHMVGENRAGKQREDWIPSPQQSDRHSVMICYSDWKSSKLLKLQSDEMKGDNFPEHDYCIRETNDVNTFHQCIICDEIFQQYDDLEKHNKRHIKKEKIDMIEGNESFQELSDSEHCTSSRLYDKGNESIQELSDSEHCTSSKIYDERNESVAISSYHCNICDMSFQQYSDIEKHNKIHKEVELETGPCGSNFETRITGPCSSNFETRITGPCSSNFETSVTGPCSSNFETGVTGPCSSNIETGPCSSNFETGVTGPCSSNFETSVTGSCSLNFETDVTGPCSSNFETGLCGSNFETSVTGPCSLNFETGVTGPCSSNFETSVTGPCSSNFETGVTGPSSSNSENSVTGPSSSNFPHVSGFEIYNDQPVDDEMQDEKSMCELCHGSYISCPCDHSNHLYANENFSCYDQDTDARTFICTVCGKTFRHKINLQQHMYYHIEGKPHKCNVCNKFFIMYSHLLAHMKTHAIKGKPFRCEVCCKSFRRVTSLQKHRSRKNVCNENKPMKCDICRKGFDNPSPFNAHLRTHTGVKPYTCVICKRSFKEKSKLTRHLKALGPVHTNPLVTNNQNGERVTSQCLSEIV